APVSSSANWKPSFPYSSRTSRNTSKLRIDSCSEISNTTSLGESRQRESVRISASGRKLGSWMVVGRTFKNSLVPEGSPSAPSMPLGGGRQEGSKKGGRAW